MRRATGDDGLVTTFGRLVEAQARLSARLGRSLEQEVGLPHAWFEVLLRISRSDGGRLSMGALAEQVVLTTGGITRLVDRMVDAGLVERVPSPKDRRVSYAALTREGEGTLQRAVSVHGANLRGVFAGFTKDELRSLDEMLDRLRSAGSG